VHAVAYINSGRWIADCPRPFCTNAMMLEPGQSQFRCQSGCWLEASVEWPPDGQALWDELMRRPVASTRNWAPAGHPMARACHVETTETAADLRREFLEIDPMSAMLADALEDFDHVQIGTGINLRQIEGGGHDRLDSAVYGGGE
jgi:hypothetical protein